MVVCKPPSVFHRSRASRYIWSPLTVAAYWYRRANSDPDSSRRRPSLAWAISRSVARLARNWPTTLDGRLARLRAWFISICASFWSWRIWLLICSSVRIAVIVFCTRLRVDHDPLRMGSGGAKHGRDGSGDKALLHGSDLLWLVSEGIRREAGNEGSRSAAQSRPRWRSQAPAKPGVPASSSTRSCRAGLAAWKRPRRPASPPQVEVEQAVAEAGL